MTVWNDGTLPNGLTIASLLQQHPSKPRNPLIADACFKAGYIDTWGRGFQKITEACDEANLPAPEFSETGGGFQVTLYRKAVKTSILGQSGAISAETEAINDISGAINLIMGAYRIKARSDKMEKLHSLLEVIIRKQGLTGKAYSMQCDIAKSTADRYLKDLKKAGILEYKGSKKTGGYYLTYKADLLVSDK